MAGREVGCRIAMRAGHRRRLPGAAAGRLLDWMEGAKAHLRANRAKAEHPFGVLKQQFVFQKTRLRGLGKKHCKVRILAAL